MLQVKEALKYPRDIAKPEKNYIFLIPKEGTVYDYRYIKEVSWIQKSVQNSNKEFLCWVINLHFF